MIAQAFFKEKSLPNNLALELVKQNVNFTNRANRTSDETGYYVINDNANNRFVIVSADERMTCILGYSDNSTFNVDEIPPGLLDMLTEYTMQYDALKSRNHIVEQPIETNVEPIPYIIKTQWGQEEPFNGDCPKDANGYTCATGCVATAMAQVMYHFKWPNEGNGGVVSYDRRIYKSIIHQSFDFDALTINWENIAESYKGSTTQAQREEIAKLMHACGVSVYMDYGIVSGAAPADIAYALTHHFRYNPNIYFAVKEYYTIEEWEELIRRELRAGRPILYGGGDHQFILDGMDEKGLYHFNFGWNGTGDGYYALDAIIVDGSYFTTGQKMVVGIWPEEIGQRYDVFYADELKIQDEVAVGSKAKILSFPVWCYSSEANTANGIEQFHGVYGVGAFDKDLNFINSLYEEKVNMNASSMQSMSGTRIVVSYNPSIFVEGNEYLLYPYAQSDNSSSPTIMRFKNGDHGWYKATVNGGKVILEKGGKIELPSLIAGDSNRDGVVDVADIVNIINYIMNKFPQPFSFENSDLDQDGVIDVADITLIVKIIMEASH